MSRRCRGILLLALSATSYGRGGGGGSGGSGGSGGGGSGGPSIAVARLGSSLATVHASTMTAGTPGSGGVGPGLAGDGATGQSGGMVPGESPVTDFDGDGITDSSDACVEIPRGTDSNGDGCPDRPAKLSDTDGDGVPNASDACPTVAADTANGCPPNVTITDRRVTEGNSGTKSASFTVRISAASQQTITVNYATANGTAKAPGDYTARSLTTLTFNPGVTTKTISVAIKGDRRNEGNETFFVRLSGATNATIADTSGKGTIIDND
jgi:hypothetical protein